MEMDHCPLPPPPHIQLQNSTVLYVLLCEGMDIFELFSTKFFVENKLVENVGHIFF